MKTARILSSAVLSCYLLSLLPSPASAGGPGMREAHRFLGYGALALGAVAAV